MEKRKVLVAHWLFNTLDLCLTLPCSRLDLEHRNGVVRKTQNEQIFIWVDLYECNRVAELDAQHLFDFVAVFEYLVENKEIFFGRCGREMY